MTDRCARLRLFCSEWLANQHRDSLASYIGHAPLTAYFAIAENESIGSIKYNLLMVGSNETAIGLAAH